MICMCTCTGRRASIAKADNGKSPCKVCEGNSLVDGRGVLSGKMLSTVGLELSKIIDPYLTWKTVSKGNRRGRRSRPSWTAGRAKKPASESLKESEDLTNNNVKKAEEMPVSESEKLGVTILGRRFSTLESVPIKKRRYLLFRSPSPPRVPSSHLEKADQLFGAISSESACLILNTDVKDLKEFDLQSSVKQAVRVTGKANQDDESEKLLDNADFSGISILASAACDSNATCGLSDAECIEVSPAIEVSTAAARANEEPNSSGVSTKDPEADYSVEVQMQTASVSPQSRNSEQNEKKLGRVEPISLRDDRSHWDLNTVMDAWEKPVGDPTLEAVANEEDRMQNENMEGTLDNHLVSMDAGVNDASVGTTAQGKPLIGGYTSIQKNNELDASVSLKGKDPSCVIEDAMIVQAEDAKALNIPEKDSCVDHEDYPSHADSDFVAEVAVNCLDEVALEKGEVLSSSLCLNQAQDCQILVENSSKILGEDGEPPSELNFSAGDYKGVKDDQSDKLMSASEVGDAIAVDYIRERSCNVVDKLDNTAIFSCQSDLGSLTYESSAHDKLGSHRGESVSFDMKKDDFTVPLDGDKSLLRDSDCCLVGLASVVSESEIKKGDSRSQEKCRSNTSSCRSGFGATENSNGNDSEVSQNESHNAILAEKDGTFQEADDDYQYEDGEFRQPLGHNWVDYAGGDEGETECVDYGSDYRDMDICETSGDYAGFELLPVERVEAEPKEASSELINNEDGAEARNDYQGRMSDTSKTNLSDFTVGVKVVNNFVKGQAGECEKTLKVQSELRIGSDKIIGKSEYGGPEPSDRGVRTKFSGWDQLPELHKNPGDKHRPDYGIYEEDPMRRVIRSTSSRELSRIGVPRSSSLHKDKLSIHRSRSDNLDNTNHRLERHASPGTFIRRNVSSTRIRGRGRGGDHWMDSSSGSLGPRRHVSPTYLCSAKVERRGLFVAADGTLIKSSCKGPSGHVGGHSTDASLRRSPIYWNGDLNLGMQRRLGSRRESPDGSIGTGRPNSIRHADHREVNAGRRERYNSSVPDDGFDVKHSLPRRERSFSPGLRRPLYSSCSRTRSRSRTRSPRVWNSPGSGKNGRISSARGLQRHSRSPPEFRSNASFENSRSPDRRSNFVENIDNFEPAPKNHRSSSHATKWIGDRRDTYDHFRDHDYKRSSIAERSPPARLLTRSRRLRMLGPAERERADDYFRPVHSGRFQAFGGADRGPRHDCSDDERRKHDLDGHASRYRFDVRDGFRAHNHHLKNNGSELQRRGSPGDHGRGFGGPRNGREEKNHYRYQQEAKPDGFKTFKTREYEDAAPRR